MVETAAPVSKLTTTCLYKPWSSGSNSFESKEFKSAQLMIPWVSSWSTRHLRTLKASHLRTLQTSHPRTEKPRHPRTKSGHPRTLRLGTSHFGFGSGGWGGGVGWGGMITFMFLCTHRHSNLIIFLAVGKRQAQLFYDQLPVGWGELIRFMFLCLHTHSNLIIFLAVEHLHALLFHDQLQNCPTQNLKIFLHPYS